MKASGLNVGLATLIAGAVFAAASAGAQQAASARGDLAVELKARKVVPQAGGSERYEPAERARPGEVVEYIATYRNTGKAPVRDVVATLPIPSETEFVPAGARPGGALATTGDGNYRPLPLKRKVKRPNGKEEEREVALGEYRSLRWNIGELQPGRSAEVAARVRISAEPTTVPPAR